MNEQSWMGEHLIRARHDPHAGAGLNMKTKTTATTAAQRIARREKVGVMHGQGISGPEMAKELGCTRTTILNDLKSLGLEVKK